MDKTLPLRPTHTGSARAQAQRGHQPRPGTTEVYRRAKHPLRLAGGSRGVALRQVGPGKIEIEVQTVGGAVYWRAADEVAQWEAIAFWVRRGF